MNRAFSYLFVFAAAVTLVACGGSGGGTTTGTTDGTTDGGAGQTVTFLSPTDSDSVAFQDGSGAWIPVTKVTGTDGTYQAVVHDTNGKYGFAVKSGGQVSVYQATVTEATQIQPVIPNPAFTNVQFKVSGLPATFPPTEKITAYAGPWGLPFQSNNTFVGPLEPKPDWDVFAVYPPTDNLAGTKYILYHGLNMVPAAPIELDLNAANAVTAEAVTVSKPALSSTFGAYLVSDTDTIAPLAKTVASSSATLYAPPLSALEADDQFYLLFSDSTSGGGGETLFRSSWITTRSLATQGIPDFPSPISGYSVTAVDASHGVYQTALTAPSGTNAYKIALAADGGNTFTVYVSSGWAGGNLTTYTTPDLSALPDFTSEAARVRTKATIDALMSQRPFTTFINKVGINGAVLATGSVSVGPNVVEATSRVQGIAIH